MVFRLFKMEKLVFQFNCRVIRIASDGINLENEGYLIKFRDNRKQHLFSIGDNLSFTIENVEKARDEVITPEKSIIYCIISSFISNGFLFMDVNQEHGFFWNVRGMLSHKRFETDTLFGHNSLIRISISKN